MEILNSLIYMTCEMAPYILLGLFIAGLLHSFVSPDLMSRHLARPGWKSVVKASLLGVPLPLCSCGVLPTAIAMRRNGASKSATSAFLISTPQTGVDSIAATWSLLGPAFAILRPVAALTTALFGGMAVSVDEKSGVGEVDALQTVPVAERSVSEKKSFFSKLIGSLRYGFYDMVRSIGGWLIGGLLIAALITEFVPTDFFVSLGRYPLLAMLAVVAVAVPMYVCATGSIPIALSLMLKGLSPGTALVLLMAGPAANFASVTLLSREMGRRSAAIYIGSIVVGAILFGLGVDYLLPRDWFPAVMSGSDACCHGSGMVAPGLFSSVCAVILAVLLIVAMISRILTRTDNKIEPTEMTSEFIVKGMSCPHCQKHVHNSIAALPGVESVSVNLSTGLVTVQGTPDREAMFAAVKAAGYDPIP